MSGRAWRVLPAKRLFRIVDERAGVQRRPPLLAVSIHHGVVPRSSLTDDEHRADDLSAYKCCDAGDLVLNRMRAFQGAIGVAPSNGLVSPDYLVLRPEPNADARFLHHLFRSRWFVAQMIARLRGIGSVDQGNVRTPRINAEDLGDIPISLPPLMAQRAIADFLDRETARIDALIAGKRRMIDLLNARDVSLAHAVITGQTMEGKRTPSGLPWLGSLPFHWSLAPVSSRFDVALGRMLNAERAAAGDMRPYVRNVNVRWDRVDIDDLAEMDFPAAERAKYRLRPGDLLINEGGAGVGRSAVWQGEAEECYIQKSILRLRSKGQCRARWMVECMRVAVAQKVPLVEGNLATIPHVPAEALRVWRFPFPTLQEQDTLLTWLDKRRATDRTILAATERQVQLLVERRQALITAAVTGEIDVSGTAA